MEGVRAGPRLRGRQVIERACQRIECPTDPGGAGPDAVVAARRRHPGAEADTPELAERQQVDARVVEGDHFGEEGLPGGKAGRRMLVMVVWIAVDQAGVAEADQAAQTSADQERPSATAYPAFDPIRLDLAKLLTKLCQRISAPVRAARCPPSGTVRPGRAFARGGMLAATFLLHGSKTYDCISDVLRAELDAIPLMSQETQPVLTRS